MGRRMKMRERFMAALSCTVKAALRFYGACPDLEQFF